MYKSEHQHAKCMPSCVCILVVSSPSQNIHLALMLLHAVYFVIDFKLNHTIQILTFCLDLVVLSFQLL